ncbi:MAG: hypothetical protein ACP5UM_07290 [Anaerolineae bacterium]
MPGPSELVALAQRVEALERQLSILAQRVQRLEEKKRSAISAQQAADR